MALAVPHRRGEEVLRDAVRGGWLCALAALVYALTQQILALLTGSTVTAVVLLCMVLLNVLLATAAGFMLGVALHVFVALSGRTEMRPDRGSLFLVAYSLLPFAAGLLVYLHLQPLRDAPLLGLSRIAATFLWALGCLTLAVILYRFSVRLRQGGFPIELFLFWSLSLAAALCLILYAFHFAGRPVLSVPAGFFFLAILSAIFVKGSRHLIRRTESERGLWRFRAFWVASGVVCYLSLWLMIQRFASDHPDWASNGAEGEVSANTPNVVLIVMDTVRAENMSLYGYPRRTTPFLDELAAEAVVFDRARSTSCWTLPSHATLFTSLYTYEHGADFSDRPDQDGVLSRKPFPLTPGATTLAETLKARGYATGGVCANFSSASREIGMGQGFESYDSRPAVFYTTPVERVLLRILEEVAPVGLKSRIKRYRSAEEINKSAFQWLEVNKGRPFFLFLNYMDCHRIYAPPSPYDRRFEGRAGFFFSETWPVYKLRNGEALSDREKRHLFSQYDGAIAYVDDQVKILVAKLREMGLYEDLLMIVTSDHGECLGEHELLGHTPGGLHEQLLWVPLLVKYPGSYPEEPRRIESFVQLVDIAPTILEVLGIPLPEDFRGDRVGQVRHPIMAEFYPPPGFRTRNRLDWGRQTALYAGENLKFIVTNTGEVQLYDIELDKGEEKDLAPADPEDVREMAAKVQNWYEGMVPLRDELGAPPEMDKDVERKLRALGYL